MHHHCMEQGRGLKLLARGPILACKPLASGQLLVIQFIAQANLYELFYFIYFFTVCTVVLYRIYT